MRSAIGAAATRQRRRTGGSREMRCLPCLALFFFLSACVGRADSHFDLAGSIDVVARYRKRAEQPNTELFVIASNAAGVPVAVRHIINPAFPVSYRMSDEDLALPGPAWRGPLRVQAFINTHGKAHPPQKGDMVGRHPGRARAGETGVDLVIDGEI